MVCTRQIRLFGFIFYRQRTEITHRA